MGIAITDEEYEKIIAENPEGREDSNGFFIFPDGSFYDPEGYKFDLNGYDELGGYYDDEGYYVPPQDRADEYYKNYEYFDDEYDEEEEEVEREDRML